MKVFGLLIDWVSSHYHQQIWAGINQFCRERGVNLLTLVTGRPGSPFEWEKMRNQLLEFVRHDPFDGFLFMTATLGNHLDGEQLRQLIERVSPAPVVSIGSPIKSVPSVVIDNRAGFISILDHLFHDHGYRRFAYAGGPLTNADARQRLDCFVDFLNRKGLEVRPDRILSGDFNMEWGRIAVEKLIPSERPDFDVLVCASDDIAIGALETLSQKDLQVPGDLALTGFDDEIGSELAAMTTAGQDLSELGRTAAGVLWDAVEGRKTIELTRLDTKLVVRQTCGCLSPAARESRVEPRSDSSASFDELFESRREQLVAELSSDGLAEAHSASLADAFLSGWKSQDSRIFIHGLQKVIATLMREKLQPGKIHFPLSVLRHWVLRATESAQHRAFAESSIHQARILLTEAFHVQSVQREARQYFVRDQLSDLNQRLLYARSFADQASILGDILGKLNVPLYRLSLYEDQQQPMAAARLVITEQGEVADGGIVYDPKQLFAPGFGAPAEPWSFVAEALFDKDEPLGFFLLTNSDPEQLSVFDQLCERVGRGIETIRRFNDLEAQVAQRTAELRELALRDELSALYNRRGFLTLAEHQLKAHYRKGHHMVLFFADLDGLKIVNDTWGHEAGDDAIRTTGRLLMETFRAEDIVARLGGDEFVVLAPGCSDHDAQGLAARLRSSFAREAQGHYGISLGWISIDPVVSRPLTEWMREADGVLYQEKQSKRTAAGG